MGEERIKGYNLYYHLLPYHYLNVNVNTRSMIDLPKYVFVLSQNRVSHRVFRKLLESFPQRF